MKKFRIMKRFCEETNSDVWSVERMDGKSFDDGIVAYNFNYGEEGGLQAIEFVKKLEQRYSGE